MDFLPSNISGAINVRTLNLMTEGGVVRTPADTGMGSLYRPVAQGPNEGRIANLSTLYEFWIDIVPDPDEALARDPLFYEKIAMHPDVQGALRKRERTVASLPDRIEANPAAKDRKTAQLVADYCSDVWNRLHDRHKLYEWMEQAVMKGGAGIEWTWHRGADGVEWPKAWSPVDKSRFVFDRLGNMALLTRDFPVWGEYVKANEVSQYLWRGGLLPTFGKFTYHVYRRGAGTWENPRLEGYIYFGIGESVPLFYPTTFDIFVLQKRMKWLEKFANTPTILSYPDNDPMSNQTAAVVNSLRGESVILRPKPLGENNKDFFFDIEQMEVPSPSYDAMSAFNKEWTKPKIDIILLGDAGESQQSEEEGGYSAHVSKHDAGPQKYYTWDAMNISATINSQIIPAIAWGRFPNLPLEYMPLHKLEPKEEKDQDQAVGIIDKSLKIGLPVTKAYAYEASGIPKPEPGEDLLQAPAPQQGQQPGQPISDTGGPQAIGQGPKGGNGAVANQLKGRMQR